MAGDIKWIKVITDIFEDEKIKLVKSMPEGRTLVLIWFQLLVQAGKTNAAGWIYLSEGCAYSPAMLSTLFNESQQMVEVALKLFSTKPFEMLEITDDGLIYIPNWEKHQNVESMDKIREKERLRKARQREKQKLLMSRDSHGTSHGTSHESHATEIELELELETDKNIYSPIIEDTKIILDHWNTKKIIVHREMPATMRNHINARLEKYTVDEIVTAIDNYHAVISDNNAYWYNHKFTLTEFVNPKNLVRFLTENNPFETHKKNVVNFKQDKQGTVVPGIEDTKRISDEMERLKEQRRKAQEGNGNERTPNTA